MIEINGTSGKIKVTKLSDYNFTVDLDETYGGQVSINTVGVITTGLWQAEVIQPQYGGTGVANAGTITTQSNISFNGIINFNADLSCANNIQIVGSGTMAFKELSLQALNCFNEFNAEQKIAAYNTIAPATTRGSLVVHDGQNNVELKLGKINQFLGTNWKTGMPEYLTPEFYSDINQMPRRRRLVFKDSDFYLRDDCKTESGQTIVHLKPRLKQLINLDGGLYAITKYKPGYGENDIHHFEPRKLISGRHIKIKNADFVDGHPIIELAESFYNAEEIKHVSTIQKGRWQAEVIQPQYGGTGCANKHKLELGADVSIQIPVEIEGLYGPEKLSIGVYDKAVRLIAKNSGVIATTHKSLQCVNNLSDIEEPAEAFRHISPTKKCGDIIVRGPGDWDIALSAPDADNKIIVSDAKSICGLAYKSIGELNELHNIIKWYVDAAFNAILKNTEKLDDYVERLGKVEKLLDDVCSQLDHMIKTKQIQPVKQLDDAMKAWASMKVKSKK